MESVINIFVPVIDYLEEFRITGRRGEPDFSDVLLPIHIY